jgi:hypothetical protein
MKAIFDLTGGKMKEKLKDKANKVKWHIKRNKGTYIASTIALAAIALQQRNLRTFDAFMTEKGIDHRDFYTSDWRDDFE